MKEEKELELSVDKIYNLPEFQIVRYKEYYLAVAVNLARWLVLENDVQFNILNALINKASIADVLEKYEEYQDDVVLILTQIEATRIDSLNPKSVFSNTRLHLHLTNQCNLHCPHCYMESGKGYDNELSTEEIKELCRNFKSIGGTDVSLTGGEPTTRSDFFDIVEYISELGMKVSVFTNGFFWNEEKVNRFAKWNIEGVQISIDGFDESSNATVRGKGVFDRALNAVDLFVKKHIYVKIAITAPYEIMKEHQAEYISFSKGLIEKYGSDSLEVNFSFFFMPGREISADKITIIKDEYYKLVNEVVTAVYGDTSEDSFVSNISDCIYDSCGYGGLNVMANGDFYFCDRIPDVNKSGNIRDMSITEIRKLMQIAEQAGRIDNFKPCKTCALKYICGGGCRAEYFKQFTETEDITAVDFEKIEPRKCDQQNKEKFYDLMVRTYERFYC